MREAFAVAFGYLLGSVLPAYFIGRAMGIDLRKVGTGNAGTNNAYHELGAGAAVATAVFDLFKGILAMLFAWRVLGVSEPFVYAAGLATIVGHMFPFYLRFRGAVGAATTSGMSLATLGVFVARGWLPVPWLLGLLALTGGLTFITKRWAPVAVIIGPLVFVAMAIGSPSIAATVFFGILVAHLVWANAIMLVRKKMPEQKPETKSRMSEMRVVLRPAAAVFPVLYLFVDKTPLLILIGSVALFFIAVDAVRLLSKRVNVAVLRRASFFYRPNEEHAFSSATLFLVASFLALFLFPKPVAGVALLFNTFGDMAAKYAGLQFGRTHVYGRTLEGSLAYFMAAAAAGFAWSLAVPIPMPLYLLGAFAASMTELLPIDLNDNFTVPLVSATVMMVPAYFGIPGFV